MNEKLYDALEVCLKALETGVEVESVLRLYPEMEDELRLLLEASARAKSLASFSVPEAAARRGRARVLQYAAEMREAAPKPRRRRSMFAFPRLATSLAIAILFLLSGTGLVSASSGALPGDNLYSVKRSWEDLRLLFVFSPEGREGLESEFEQERLDEISELLTEGRNETIAFAGLVTVQQDQEWKISGITVMITSSSRLPADPIEIGTPVMVVGHTNAQGFVEVDTLEKLGPGVSLPPLEPSHEEGSASEDSQEQGEEPESSVDVQPKHLEKTTFDFQGVIESMDGNLWTINGQRVNVEFAEIRDTFSVGVLAKFEGYYSTEGEFIVTKIELKSGGTSIQSSGGRGDGGDSSNDKSSGGGGTGNDPGGGDNEGEGEGD